MYRQQRTDKLIVQGIKELEFINETGKLPSLLAKFKVINNLFHTTIVTY